MRLRRRLGSFLRLLARLLSSMFRLGRHPSLAQAPMVSFHFGRRLSLTLSPPPPPPPTPPKPSETIN